MEPHTVSKLLKIGALASKAGLSRDTIRFYEREALLPKPPRTPAGYRLYSGVHVPSKAFAEVVEHEAGTPWISAPDLKALIDSGADIAIFDSRSYE